MAPSGDPLTSVYFIGIGGIGMSAIARYFKSKGVKVAGYDKTESPLTKELEQEGIQIHYEENVSLVPGDVQLVVFTPAIPGEHAELVHFREKGFEILKRSDVLQLITEKTFNICVAGTHGKTTITTMIAHLLRHTGYGCNAFLGGIAVNYGTNFWADEKAVCVVEADEYDRSFHKLSPDVAVITAMDPDHLDIYGTPDKVEEAFIEFSNKIRSGGTLVSKFGLKRGKELKASNHVTYSLQNESSGSYASNIRMMKGSYQFDVMMKDNMLDDVVLNMGGMHNVENAVAAITVASSLKIPNDKIKAAVEAFRGVKRRFEYIIKEEKLVFIDDYAHHPEELRALINGAKTLFRQMRCTVIFQPHLYTRTRDLSEGFAESLAMADRVILLPIYPARELPIEGVSSEMIISEMGHGEIVKKENLLSWVSNHFMNDLDTEFGEVIVTAGAGDIDTLVEPIKDLLTTR